MRVEQFVMAYRVEQDRLRAMLPKGFDSLRPVLRINVEIRESGIYLECNTPVSAYGKRGWLNVANWATPDTAITCTKDGLTTTFETDFLKISFLGVGITGGCPAEKGNDGCFYGTDWKAWRPRRPSPRTKNSATVHSPGSFRKETDMVRALEGAHFLPRRNHAACNIPRRS